MKISPLTDLDTTRFGRPDILKKLAIASRQLAELKGVVASMPNQGILTGTLGLQEAKDSSAIENIGTTHDELFRAGDFPDASTSLSTKEVARYRQALQVGYESVKETGLLTNNHIVKIQETLDQNQAGFRKLPGTMLKDNLGKTVYVPPRDPAEVARLMG